MLLGIIKSRIKCPQRYRGAYCAQICRFGAQYAFRTDIQSLCGIRTPHIIHSLVRNTYSAQIIFFSTEYVLRTDLHF